MRNRRITRLEVQQFIGGKGEASLRDELRDDYREHRFIREADLEVCTYYHLRKFLKPDPRWRVFARAYMKGLRRFPDMVILDEKFPRIVIELKWKSEQISRKDRQTLNKFLARRHAKKAYFLTTVDETYEKLRARKEDDEKFKLKEVVVPLGLDGTDLTKFKNERRGLKALLAV